MAEENSDVNAAVNATSKTQPCARTIWKTLRNGGNVGCAAKSVYNLEQNPWKGSIAARVGKRKGVREKVKYSLSAHVECLLFIVRDTWSGERKFNTAWEYLPSHFNIQHVITLIYIGIGTILSRYIDKVFSVWCLGQIKLDTRLFIIQSFSHCVDWWVMGWIFAVVSAGCHVNS